MAFVELIDTLVDDFDVIDLLTVLAMRCVDLLDVTAAGILLADERGDLRVMAASTEEVGLLELFQIQNEEGPCLECFRSGSVIGASDLADPDLGRWPSFARESLSLGYRAVFAIPLRLRDRILGCLNLFTADAALLTEHDIALARALADTASIAIVQDELARAPALRELRLQNALTSRIAIEQAKGMLSAQLRVDMDAAVHVFAVLRPPQRTQAVDPRRGCGCRAHPPAAAGQLTTRRSSIRAAPTRG